MYQISQELIKVRAADLALQYSAIIAKYYITSYTHTAFKGCPLGSDPTWSVMWANTQPGTSDIERCPGGLESFGMAIRFCNKDGTWETPDVTRCGSLQFQIILQQVNTICK